ncbi:MAG: aldehyde dehydrogenase family protein [Streptosporangiaceae bacterium]
MALMDESVWRGKVFSGGWVGGDLGTGLDASVIEPATGQEIGRTGIATPADVARAAQIAAAAQPAWAATPHTERSAILRRAADIWLAHAADIEWWGIRESGKIPSAMQFETHVATQEIYEAATLPSRAYGELLPSEQPRLSFAERVPVGVTGVVAPVLRFSTAEDAAKLAAESEYGLSLGILTRDVMRGLELARQIPTGIVHINEQTVDDEPNIPFGGIGASGTGARFGGAANLEAFTDTRWVTIRGDIAPYPF